MPTAMLMFIANIFYDWWLASTRSAAGAAVSICVAFWVFDFAIYLWKPIPRLALYSYTSLLVAGAVFSSLYGKVYSYQLMAFWVVLSGSVLIFFNAELKEVRRLIASKLRKAGN